MAERSATAADCRWQVFLSYSRRDKAFVEKVLDYLGSQDITVWFDRKEINLGDRWQDKIEEGLKNSRAIAVFVGPGGLGNWEGEEMRAAIDMAVNNKKIRVIPVLLPGVTPESEAVPMFLRNYSACMLQGADDHENLGRLSWAISGRNPILPRRGEPASSAVAAAASPVQEALAQLREHLRAGENITFFVGRCATNPGAHCEITATLLRDIDLIDPNHDNPLPQLDLAASFFAARNTDSALEHKVVEALDQRPAVPPLIHAKLAKLLSMRGGRTETRGRRRFRQLIVTTSFDLALEMALAAAGMAFTRLVQYRAEPRVKINVIANAAPLGVNAGDEEQFGKALSAAGERDIVVRNGTMYESVGSDERPVEIDQLPEPIVYKLLGSRDIPDSCTISTEQHYDAIALSIAQKSIPEQVNQIISNTPMVLLGAKILDADFRLSYALLKKALDSGRADTSRFAVAEKAEGDQRDYAFKLGLNAWDRLKARAAKKYGIEMLDTPGDRFLSELG
jgi:TIR domain-containing protein/SIR2-like protein